jgi:ribonuclease BN (tRNA processing enzyme)
MLVTVLGSGTLLPDDQRRSPAHLIEVEGARLLMDCGSGTVHGFDRHRVPWRTLTHVALTHFHTDHVGDLAPLLFAFEYGVRPKREEPLVLIGPPGLRPFLERLAAAHGDWVTRPAFPLEVVELSREDAWEHPAGRFRLRTHPTPHTANSIALRVEHPDGTVGYTGDTGPSDELAAFFRGVALLISECSLEDPPAMEAHLSPRSVARLAVGATPDLLLVTHVYPPLRPHRVPDLLVQAGYAGRALVARDGTRVEVLDGRAVWHEG